MAACRYLSNIVTLQIGEVVHLLQAVRLPRPEGARAIVHFSVDLMQQTASELHPAPAQAVYLKRLALHAPDGAATECAAHGPAIVVAGERSERMEMHFAEPYGLVPNASDVWRADLHLIRTEGIKVPIEHAQQCACMREDIGSTHCCPHSCRFPSQKQDVAAAQYRLSIALTWTIVDAEAAAAPQILPLTPFWVPVGGPGASFSAPRQIPSPCQSTATSSRTTEFDVLACRENQCKGSAATRFGPWFELDSHLIPVAALAVTGPRLRRASLVSGEGVLAGQQHELCNIAARDAIPSCALLPATQTLAGARKREQQPSVSSQIQARAEFDATAPILGADVGFIVYAASQQVLGS